MYYLGEGTGIQWLGYGMDDHGSIPSRDGNFRHRVKIPFKAHAAVSAFSQGIKWPGREANHSPPSSVEVRNVWSCMSNPPIRLHGVAFNEEQTQFYF
jgi:hypothetical protein